MKNIIALSFFIMFLFFDKDIQKTVFPKGQIWAFVNDGNLKKDAKTVKDKKLIELGQKLSAVKEKKDNDKTYYQVQMPDGSKYWLNAEEVTEKYITINSNDVTCYSQPDNSAGYLNSYKLQPGDFGYFVKEQGGFVNVKINNYIPPSSKEKDAIWVDNVWINGGYTDDIKSAKEAYNLALAYYYIYCKTPNKDTAKYFLKKAIEANGDDKTEIASVAQQVLDGLK